MVCPRACAWSCVFICISVSQILTSNALRFAEIGVCAGAPAWAGRTRNASAEWHAGIICLEMICREHAYFSRVYSDRTRYICSPARVYFGTIVTGLRKLHIVYGCVHICCIESVSWALWARHLWVHGVTGHHGWCEYSYRPMCVYGMLWSCIHVWDGLMMCGDRCTDTSRGAAASTKCCKTWWVYGRICLL